MKYVRTWRNIHMSHFNGEREYTALWINDFMTALAGTHGHNMAVTISLITATEGGAPAAGFIVDDAIIDARVIGELRDRNLSVHPIFLARGWRATTERIAEFVVERTLGLLNEHKVVPVVTVGVKVYETEDIMAELWGQHRGVRT
jgi:6-pyruvoyl-tetrahydropterin synthase